MNGLYMIIDSIYIFVLTGALSGIIQNMGANSLLRIIGPINILLYAFMLYRLCLIKIKIESRCMALIYIFMGSCIISLFSNQNMGAVFQSILYLFLNVIYAYYLYCAYKLEDFLHLLFIVLVGINIISSILSIAIPKIGTYYDSVYHAQVWRGIFTHKNTLGNASVLLMLIWLINKKSRKNKLLFIGIISAAMNLLLSHSNTPKYALIVCLAYLAIKKIINKEWSMLILIGTSLASYIYLFHYSFVERIFNGYDVSITGRRPIYDIVISLISKKPVLGYGLGSCWIEGSRTYNSVLKYVGFNPNASHNGFLELALNIGVVGLIAYLIMLIAIFAKSYNYYKIGNKNLMVLMIFIIIMSMFESTLAQVNTIYWIIQMIVLFNVVGDGNKEKSALENINYGGCINA